MMHRWFCGLMLGLLCCVLDVWGQVGPVGPSIGSPSTEGTQDLKQQVDLPYKPQTEQTIKAPSQKLPQSSKQPQSPQMVIPYIPSKLPELAMPGDPSLGR